jgi:hypothetical protein
MGEIRAFSEEFVRQAADLQMKLILGRRNQPASEALQNHFRQVFLRSPWFTPEAPSWMYLDQGNLVGFAGIVCRPMEFRGRPIRVASLSQFMVDGERHKGNGAIELLRRCFAGPQDITYTDGIGREAVQLWYAAGALPAYIQSFNWARILRPARIGAKAFGRLGPLGAVARAVAGPADYLISRLPVEALRLPTSPLESRPVSPDEMLAVMKEAGPREPLKPVYTQPSFEWLLATVQSPPHAGKLRTLAVRDAKGAACGWCIYLARPSGMGFVLQIASRRRDQFGAVLSALFRDAWLEGCTDVRGSAIPKHLTELTAAYCLFRQAEPCVALYCRDKELANDIRTGDASLSRLDGISWMGFVAF